jgi:hypothetical protein
MIRHSAVYEISDYNRKCEMSKILYETYFGVLKFIA